MPDSALDDPVYIFAGEFFGIRTGIRVWCTIGVTLSSVFHGTILSSKQSDSNSGATHVLMSERWVNKSLVVQCSREVQGPGTNGPRLETKVF